MSLMKKLTMIAGIGCGKMTSCISDKRKIIFIHLTKTGGTTIQKILMGYQDFYLLDDDIIHGHSQWKTMVEINPELAEKLKTYTVFTIVRNPVNRFISAYNDFFHTRMKQKYVDSSISLEQATDGKEMQRLGFYGFYSHAHIQMVDSLPDLKYIDKVIKFENFEEEARQYLSTLGISVVNFPKCRVSRKVIKPENVPSDLKRKIRSLFKEDFEVFGYE